MGHSDPQRSLFAADHLHRDYVGKDSFFVWPAIEGPALFPDQAFAGCYVLDNGRTGATLLPSLTKAARL